MSSHTSHLTESHSSFGKKCTSLEETKKNRSTKIIISSDVVVITGIECKLKLTGKKFAEYQLDKIFIRNRCQGTNQVFVLVMDGMAANFSAS